MKLIRIEKSISIHDSISHEHLERIDLDISFEELYQIVPPPNDDPNYCDCVIINELQLGLLNKYLSKGIVPDFSRYYYVLECLGIYDWDAS